jgi:catechol 2,3-dioxygenase-like lactoylglutathione lyase family enzyme
MMARVAPLTHVAIRTHDVDSTIDFYRRYAGLHIVHERADDVVRVVWLSSQPTDPEFVIVVLQMPYESQREPAPIDHLGFAVASREEVDAIGDLARSEGLLKWGPTDAGPIVGYIAMVRDPSGNTREFSFGQPIHPKELAAG